MSSRSKQLLGLHWTVCVWLIRRSKLPQTLPTRGAWKLDLDGTRLVQPSGYVEQWPFNGMVQTSRVQGDRAHGRVARAGMMQGLLLSKVRLVGMTFQKRWTVTLAQWSFACRWSKDMSVSGWRNRLNCSAPLVSRRVRLKALVRCVEGVMFCRLEGRANG